MKLIIVILLAIGSSVIATMLAKAFGIDSGGAIGGGVGGAVSAVSLKQTSKKNKKNE